MRTLSIDDDMPANARRLYKAGEAAGWKVWATAARGTLKDREVDSVVVRLSRSARPGDSVAATGDDVRLFATWIEGKFAGAVRQSPFGRLSSRELTAMVTS